MLFHESPEAVLGVEAHVARAHRLHLRQPELSAGPAAQELHAAGLNGFNGRASAVVCSGWRRSCGSSRSSLVAMVEGEVATSYAIATVGVIEVRHHGLKVRLL